ncbi:MLP-like protein 328 [Camellia lanceoleosa]|uniref:MLP-like protein 328 n=1 Tax=Camellia lanceoleosa TaxID=1840588 RepID=A0ACC0G2M7_9ERIC|nr:MLP-like protein 328 [Camellia lanceoleosa]
MALAGKMETEVEIKSDGDEILHMFGGKKAHHVPNLVSHHIQNVDLHEGEWGDHGSVKAWTCVVEGKVETYKERVSIDEENKTVHLTALEGTDCLEFYKSYNLIFQIIPKGETKVVKITIEYEKRNKDVPDPQKYLNHLINLFKDVDSKLVQA